MSYVAAITDRTTGETRTEKFDLEWGEGSDYLWSDGNFGCDCNRAQFFAVAAGGINLEHPCSMGTTPARFFVSIWSNGKIVYADEEDETDDD